MQPNGELETDSQMYEYARRLAQGRIFKRLQSGVMQDIDVIGFLGHTVEYQRQKFEMGQELDQHENFKLVLQILQIQAPKLLAIGMQRDALGDDDKAFLNRLAAEHNIQGTTVEDKRAAGMAAVDKQIHDKLVSMGVRK